MRRAVSFDIAVAVVAGVVAVADEQLMMVATRPYLYICPGELDRLAL